MDKYALGTKGEMLAKTFLEEKGYEIIDMNVNYPSVGEIDIVAKDGGVLVFIEVRARSDKRLGHPLETLTKAKLRRVVQASKRFISERKIPASGYRYDVVAILYDTPELIKNAFFARWN